MVTNVHACYVNPAFVRVYGFMSAQLQALEPFCLDGIDRETTESGFSSVTMRQHSKI